MRRLAGKARPPNTTISLLFSFCTFLRCPVLSPVFQIWHCTHTSVLTCWTLTGPGFLLYYSLVIFCVFPYYCCDLLHREYAGRQCQTALPQTFPNAPTFGTSTNRGFIIGGGRSSRFITPHAAVLQNWRRGRLHGRSAFFDRQHSIAGFAFCLSGSVKTFKCFPARAGPEYWYATDAWRAFRHQIVCHSLREKRARVDFPVRSPMRIVWCVVVKRRRTQSDVNRIL